MKGHLSRLKALVLGNSSGEVALRFLELIWGYPLYLVSFITPRRKNKWAFGTNVGFVDNAKYLFIDTFEKKEIACYWIAPTRKSAETIRKKGLPAYYKYSLKGLYHCLTASVYIFTYHSKDINFFTSGRVKKVNLWHGVGIKSGNTGKESSGKSRLYRVIERVALPHLFEKYKLFLSTSPLMNEHFKKMFHLNGKEIFENIYPRCEFICREKQQIEYFISRYEDKKVTDVIDTIKRFSKTYLYMPTWRSDLKDNFLKEAGFDFPALNRILAQKDELLILKLHPAVRILQSEYSNFDHILFLDKGLDIYPILPYTQVLITDYSSIYYDYILMKDKEVILYPFDLHSYQKDSDSLAFDYEEYTPGKRVYTMPELLDALKNEGKFHVAQRDKIIDLFWKSFNTFNADGLYNRIRSL